MAAILLTALTASPAWAGWQFTEWGMTEQQVVQAGGGRVAREADGMIRMAGPTVFAGEKFGGALFAFVDGRLDRVNFETDGSSFDVTDAALAAQFGQAVMRREGPRPMRVYIDRAKSNAVWLIGGPYTTLAYRPIEAGF